MFSANPYGKETRQVCILKDSALSACVLGALYSEKYLTHTEPLVLGTSDCC